MKVRSSPCGAFFLALALVAIFPARSFAGSTPVITTQPQSLSQVLGSNALFSVVATGPAPLFYQWSVNGANLSDSAHIGGAASSSLIVSNVTVSDAGNYQVVVSNSHGSVTSSKATLTVLVPAGITAHPASQAILLSSNATFTGSVSGTAPVHCQWFFNGSPLADSGRVSGSGTTNLSLFNVQTNDAGAYQLVVTNNYGAATSAVATLSVLVPPYILVQPSNQVVTVSSNASLAVLAGGTTPLSYQWFIGGRPLTDGGRVSGSRTASLNIANAQVSDGGFYQVVVTNGYGTATSSKVVLGTTFETEGLVRFVNVNSTNPIAPFLDWSTAATNIQSAINASSASAGDTVIVSPGAYNESINFNGKPVWLSSANGPSITVINPPAGSSSIIFDSGETSNSVVLGFTITNGGISVASSSPMIISNVLLNCGTGIYCDFASPSVIDNLISGGSGSGIYLIGADTAFILGNIIQKNGGGIGMWAAGSPTIINNLIQNNQGTAIGMVNECDANIVQNVIVNNGGDGINALVPSGARGPWLINNTLYENAGNGIYEDGFVSAGEIVNNIVVGSPALNLNPWYGGAPPVVQFNDFYATGGGVYTIGYYTNLNNINGNFSADPFFASVLSGDFDLSVGSPCIDAGTNGAPLLPALDFTGVSRMIAGNANGPGITDMGAYEFHAPDYISIQVQPSSETLLAGQNAYFSVAAISTDPLTYQWQLNGTNLADGNGVTGATSPNLALFGVITNNAGNYRVVVANSFGSVTSSVAALFVWQAPVILVQPSNTVASVFGSRALSVTVTGAPPIYFQWQKNGIDLVDGGTVSGSGSPTLLLTNLQFSDAGQYDVIVSNASGTAMGSDTLTVVPIVLWGNDHGPLPASATNLIAISAGGDFGWGEFNLVLRADGTVVAWGDDYAGSSEVPATATNVVSIAAGDYHGLALRQDGTVVGWGENSYGEATPPANVTNIVSVAAGQWHSLALRSDGTVVGWGENSYGEATPPANATNVIAIAAGGDFSLALRQDGMVIGWGANGYGQAAPPASITNALAIAAGENLGLALGSDGNVAAWGYPGQGFSDTISPPNATNIIAIAAGNSHNLALRQDGAVIGWGYNNFGEINVPANLTNVVAISAKEFHSMALVLHSSSQTLPIVYQQPRGGSPQTGQNFVLITQATGPLPFSFQWYFNGAPLAGQTNNWLALAAINTNQVGNYQLVVANNFGAVTSQVAVVSETPGIIAEPLGQLAFTGGSITFTSAVTGIGPFGYQWYLNGAALADSTRISGSTTASLTVSNIQLPDGGNYTLIVTNNSGSTATSVASLNVFSQPTDQTVLQGSSVSISVMTNSPAPVAFQWFENGIALTNGGRINGAFGPSLIITGSQIGDSGAYQVVITNSSGSLTSTVASLTVMAPAFITSQPASQAVLIGSTATFSAGVAGTYLHYQWYKNGQALSDDGHFGGSATPTLSIFNVQSNDAGGYVLAVSNILSSATTVVAALTPLTVPGPSARYVSSNSTNPATPYLDWSTAAQNIQDAIDASVNGDSIVVTDGVYQAGGRVVYGALTNRVVINKALTVRSVNGPATTTILGNRALGNNAVRCAYLTNGALLKGFTLTSGATRTTGDIFKEQSGGGAWCESTNARLVSCLIVSNRAWLYGGGEWYGALTNCTLAGNTATNLFSSPGFGGGAAFGVLNNCLLSGNLAEAGGGGAYSNLLNNCVLAGNWATNRFSANTLGGGADLCTLNNCVLSNNISASGQGGGANASTLNNCLVCFNGAPYGGGAAQACLLNNCTVVWNSGGVPTTGGSEPSVISGSARNSIIYYNGTVNSYATYLTNCCTTPVAFLPYSSGSGNFSNAPLFLDTNSDFHLQSSSPCINAGNNAFVTVTNDLDGHPRIVGGTVDVGAFEYQTPASVISYAWLEQYGLPTDGSVDYLDLDGTGMNDWQKWIAGLNPTNPASVLIMLPPVATNNPTGVTVSWRSVNTRSYYLQRSSNLNGQPPFSSIRSNLVGQVGTTSYKDTTATNGGPYFYRIGVQ